MDAATVNREVVVANVVAGPGMFIECLDRALRRRGIAARLTEHDPVAELTDAGAVAP
jgi:hypothetical protein